MPQTNSAAHTSSFSLALAKFDALASREKRLIFIAMPALVFFVFASLLIEPLYKDIKSLKARSISSTAQLNTLKETSSELLQEVQRDPDAMTKQQITQLQNRLTQLSEQFDSELGQLVPPKEMPVLLGHLFERAKGLELIKMESIAPTPVFTEQGHSASAQLYRQGIRISFQGSYFATRDFFADAELLKWQLYWKFLHYDVQTHPLATTHLEVFTLSTSEAFIGVN